MVYHVTRISKGIALSTSAGRFLYHWVLYALACYLAIGYTSLASSRWWFMLAMALPAALVAFAEFRRMHRHTETYENLFYTLTEGGLLVESGDGKTAAFFSWADLTEARLVLRHTVYLQHKNGKGINCLLEGLPKARIAEFVDFAAGHVGTTPPPAVLTRPPRELMAAPPLVFSATPAQCRVLADTRALLAGPAWVWTWLRPALLLLLGFCLLYYADRASYPMMILIIVFFLRPVAAGLRNPGGSAEALRSIRPSRCHVLGRQWLAMTPDSGSWMLNRQAQPAGIYHTPLGVCVADSDTVLMLDPDQPLPPLLQSPCRQLPRHLSRRAVTSFLVLIFLAAAYLIARCSL